MNRIELNPLIVKGVKNKSKSLNDYDVDGEKASQSVYSKRLQLANTVAAVFHFTLFLMITIIGAGGKAPYTVFFDTFWADYVIPENVRTPFCCLQRPEHCSAQSAPGYGEGDPALPDCKCKTYVEGEFSEWIACENRYSSEWKDLNWDFERLYSPKIKNVFEIKTWVLLSVFELLTFLMHFYLRVRHDTYMWYVRNKLQPYRWLEYSVTSPIMLVAVASLSSITDIHLLLYMFLIQSYINLTGGWLYELCAFLQSRVETNWNSDMDGLARSSIVYTKWFFFFFAWLGFILEFVTIFGAFYAVLDPYFELESGDLWMEIFFFVEIAVWGLFTSYLSFPVIHLYQIAVPYLIKRPRFRKWKRLINKNYYYNAELGYIVASFFSKGFLTGVIFYAAMKRDSDQTDKVSN